MVIDHNLYIIAVFYHRSYVHDMENKVACSIVIDLQSIRKQHFTKV